MINIPSLVVLFSVVVASLILPSEIPRANAATPIMLDGIGVKLSGRCCFGSPQSQQLSTSRGHDVILVLVRAAPGENVTVSDTSGVSFTQRLSFTSGPSNVCSICSAKIFEFYGISNPVLNSDNITVAVTTPCCSTLYGIQAIAVSSANTRAVFDQNPSIPASVSCSSPQCGTCEANGFGLCSESIQTSTIDIVVATTAINDAGGCGVYTHQAPPPGFIRIASPNSNFEVDYTITNEPHSTVTFDCYGTDTEAIVLDAVSFFGAFGT